VRVRIAVVAAVAALGSAGAAMAFSPAATPTLKGTVGPGFTITLKNSKGKKVKTLKAGTYRLVVSDKASIHSFVLEGPGVSRTITSVPFVGTKAVTVKLRKGNYKYYCRPHESSMFGFVAVT
jgi:plastocyanin